MRALGLDATEGTHYHRDAVDGRPIGNRYRTACLGRIGTFSETYAHLGLDHALLRACAIAGRAACVGWCRFGIGLCLPGGAGGGAPEKATAAV